MSLLKLIFKFIFFFFGTFLHELAHYTAAFLLGKPASFSVCPKIENNSFIFGSVKYRVRHEILTSFVASAPLIWWLVLIYMLFHFHILNLSSWMPSVNYELIRMRLRSFSLTDAVFIWGFLQLLWAGRLSTTDIKNLFSGIFSVSGLIFIALISIAVYLLWYLYKAAAI